MRSLYNFQRFNGGKDRKVRYQSCITPCKRYLFPDILYKRLRNGAILKKEKARHDNDGPEACFSLIIKIIILK